MSTFKREHSTVGQFATQLLLRVYDLLRARTQYNHLLFMALFCSGFFGFWISFQIRFDFEVPELYQDMLFRLAPYVALTKALLFFVFRGHATNWRYVGLRDGVQLAVFSIACGALLYGVRYLGPSFIIPRGVIVIDVLCTLVFTGGIRVSARFVRETIMNNLLNGAARPSAPTIIVGAGDAGELLIREIRRNPASGMTVKALFDDDPSKQGMSIHGVRVVGGVEAVPDYVAANPIERIIVAIPSANRSQMKRINSIVNGLGVSVKALPSYLETMDSTPGLEQLRDLNITDLLGREEIKVDAEQLSELIQGRVVLVTGAGGSIGSELCRQILKHGPSSLIMVERGENNLFHTHRKLSALCSPGESDVLTPILCDVTHERRLRSRLKGRRPHVIFHAAAHKHVGLQESHPYECFVNNVGGTRTLAKLADELGVERFLLISTDKAVNPTSVMGATKRICESYCQAFAGVSKTVFMAVRFGNVLASEGSVVPIFMEQIANGGPVTITHPDVQRYFMTIPEAVALVLQAAAIGSSGQLLILDMGAPVRIVDLAKQMISLAGRDPETFPISYTGLRNGEKLFEELSCPDEVCVRTVHEKIRVFAGSVENPRGILCEIDRRLSEALKSPDTFDVCEALEALAPGYRNSARSDGADRFESDKKRPADSTSNQALSV